MIVIIGDPEIWGLIPGFLDEDDPRPAKEQINEKYQGGWQHIPEADFDYATLEVLYPGDPPSEVMGALHFRDEVLLYYPGEFILILQKDGSWEFARLN